MIEKQSLSQFRDLSGLMQWIKAIIYTYAALNILAIISDGMELQLFSSIQEGFISREPLFYAVESNDNRQLIIGILYSLVFILSAIFIGRWIFLGNQNVRNLGAPNMQFTPGWAVGWYFIPIANLWKPFQSMKEIWLNSYKLSLPEPGIAPTALLGWWWFLWLTGGIAANIAFRLTLQAQDIDTLYTATSIAIFSDILTLPLCFVTLYLITQINNAQTNAYELAKQNQTLAPDEPSNAFGSQGNF